MNYRGKLKSFLKDADKIDWEYCVLLPNMTEERTDDLRNNPRIPEEAKKRIFAAGSLAAFTTFVSQHLAGTTLDAGFVSEFLSSPVEYTPYLFDYLAKNGKHIASGIYAALADIGFGLTYEQERLCEEIIAAAEEGKPKQFIINGGAGSGKTLVAVNLLLRYLGIQANKQEADRKPAILGIRGNRLYAVLKDCLSSAYGNASGIIDYFYIPQGNYQGLADLKNDRKFGLLVCDEAQRMQLQHAPVIFGRAPVVAIFIDEKQRINPDEEGRIEAFKAYSNHTIEKQLTQAIRCQGGQAYHDWIEQLLEGKAEGSRERGWLAHYALQVTDDFDQMHEALAQWRNTYTRVALVASFTESRGDKNYPTSPKNTRVGFPIESKAEFYRNAANKIYWLMQPSEYVRFWARMECNNLTHAASIYGAQGFECDYAGVIWGRDYIYRPDTGFTLGDPQYCYDTQYGLVSKDRKSWCPDALELLKNRYRIFLTRAMRGTFIWCEDEQTRQYLINVAKSA